MDCKECNEYKKNQLQKEDKSNTKLLIGFFIAFFAIFGITILYTI